MITRHCYPILARIILCSSTLYSFMTHAFTISQADLVSEYIINQSGTWQLTESVTFTNPQAISIVADNVTLNLQGYTIDGQEVGGCAILISGSNCTVVNGAI